MLIEDDDADVGLLDNSNRTAYQWAEENGYAEIADLLINNGADYSSELDDDE